MHPDAKDTGRDLGERRELDGARVATLGRAITIPPLISRPMVSTITGNSTLG